MLAQNPAAVLKENTQMLFGDAKASVDAILKALLIFNVRRPR